MTIYVTAGSSEFKNPVTAQIDGNPYILMHQVPSDLVIITFTARFINLHCYILAAIGITLTAVFNN
jgi:hypothetical protein